MIGLILFTCLAPISPELGLLYAPGPIFVRAEKFDSYWDDGGASYLLTKDALIAL